MKGVQAGRSFFLQPTNKPEDLGDFFELWRGLFQSTVLGSVPYLNVDGSFKAFPKPYKNMVDLFYDANENRAKLLQHLKGMDICYNMPGTTVRRNYRFIGLDRAPADCLFEQNGKRISVLEYFKSRNIEIKFPNLPCIKLGIRNICVPAEFCSLSGAQVNLLFMQRSNIFCTTNLSVFH